MKSFALRQHNCAGAAKYAARLRLRPKSSKQDRGHVASRAADAIEEAPSGAQAPADLPMPIIKLDNHSDPFTTIVTIDYGDRLGELLDTIQALKNLGYNITRAKMSDTKKNKFFITNAKTGEKVTMSAELEGIRQCIIKTMVDYHPEVSGMVSAGSMTMDSGSRKALGALGADRQINRSQTIIKIKPTEDGRHTKLTVSTFDRPGLLVDIVRTLKDCNVNVLSAEVDTIGSTAEDEFLLTYHGEPLSGPVSVLVKNALQYYLALAEIETEESYQALFLSDERYQLCLFR
eukprot:TRINITY_DN5388_c0_g2_i1.p1 TRINITY_DN5388_c0_g2~~TRINITY_DN5388_c0_g2_i1.p1  ORF type:complete len:289 (-),score=33.43 TRINITY_DN5388_c0_g2_i1:146-1012(-)